jgi:hypothetical protein
VVRRPIRVMQLASVPLSKHHGVTTAKELDKVSGRRAEPGDGTLPLDPDTVQDSAASLGRDGQQGCKRSLAKHPRFFDGCHAECLYQGTLDRVLCEQGKTERCNKRTRHGRFTGRRSSSDHDVHAGILPHWDAG